LLTAEHARATSGDPKTDKQDKTTLKPLHVRGGIPWYDLEVGIAEAQRTLRPLLIVHAGSGDGIWPTIEERLIEEYRKKLLRFVAVEIPHPMPKSAAKVLGASTDVSVIAFADFQRTLYKRWDGEVPRQGSFRKFLRLTENRTRVIAHNFSTAFAVIEKGRYALKTKKYKKAVQHYLAAEKLPLPPESLPIKERAELRKGLDKVIAERKAEAKVLEDKDDLAASIALYERIMNDFPLPDVKKELRAKVTDLWSRLRGYGG